ncbi:MAG: hypothetical protein ACK5RO_04870 [Pseudobdellovibrionaceae bacterium]
MESISPLLESMIKVRFSLERGESMQQACRALVSHGTQSKIPLLAQIERLLLLGNFENDHFQVHTVNFLSLVQAGLQGQSVYQHLVELEADVYELSSQEIEKFSALLPILGLFPLLLLIFPALVLITIVPFIGSLSVPL